MSSIMQSVATVDLNQKAAVVEAMNLIRDRKEFLVVATSARSNWERFQRTAGHILETGDHRQGWRHWLDTWSAWDFYTIYHSAVKAGPYLCEGKIEAQELRVSFRLPRC